MHLLAQAPLRLNASGVDYLLLALYFLFVLGIGVAARRSVSTNLDFFLSGRALPMPMISTAPRLAAMNARPVTHAPSLKLVGVGGRATPSARGPTAWSAFPPSRHWTNVTF